MLLTTIWTISEFKQMNPFKFKISLRIKGFDNSISHKSICSELKMEPNRIWNLGQPRTTPNGDPLPGKCDRNFLLFRLLGQEDEDLVEMLERITNDLMNHEELFQRIRHSGGRSEFFIGWFSTGNTGEVFESALLGRLARLGIDFSLDIYGESDPKIPELDDTN